MEQQMKYMGSKNIIIVDRENDLLIVAREGTGDNLTEEDEQQGYKDYAMITIYQIDGSDLDEVDGGQMLGEVYIADLSYDEYAKRVMDFAGVSSKDYQYVKF